MTKENATQATAAQPNGTAVWSSEPRSLLFDTPYPTVRSRASPANASPPSPTTMARTVSAAASQAGEGDSPKSVPPIGPV